MKKSKRQEQQEVNAAFALAAKRRRWWRHGIKPTDPRIKLPSQVQLATLAATLARSVADAPEKLCETGLDLWIKSAERLAMQAECNADERAQAEVRDKNRVVVPEPKQDHVSVDEFCRLLMPDRKGRTADQAFIYKAWLRDSLEMSGWLRSGQEGQKADFAPSKQQIDAAYASHRKTGMDHRDYHHRALSFIPWYCDWKKRQSSEKSKNAARARWKKNP